MECHIEVEVMVAVDQIPAVVEAVGQVWDYASVYDDQDMLDYTGVRITGIATVASAKAWSEHIAAILRPVGRCPIRVYMTKV
jgi:hypothetical protein